jgi:hypothetical protein
VIVAFGESLVAHVEQALNKLSDRRSAVPETVEQFGHFVAAILAPRCESALTS